MEVDMDMNDDEVVPMPLPQTHQQSAEQAALVPKHTIYIRNLNYKMEMNEMRKALYAEFCKFGKILDIVVGVKRFAIKGQAWVIFDRIEDATAALQEMNGKVILNRPVTIAYAKVESDLILKREGRFVYQKRTFESYADKLAKEAEEDASGRMAAVRQYIMNSFVVTYSQQPT